MVNGGTRSFDEIDILISHSKCTGHVVQEKSEMNNVKEISHHLS